MTLPVQPVSAPPPRTELGAVLVLASAVTWSFGGALTRYLTLTDSWTIVFWRCLFAGGFLFLFMALRDGPRGMRSLFANMGWPGLVVAFSFMTATTAFIVAIGYTTVANVILIQASVPLLAALMMWIFYREKVSLFTWAAIAAVIFGIAIMVSDSLTGTGSPIGNGLAILIAVVFAITTVLTRKHPEVRMTPAAFVGSMAAVAISSTQAASLAIHGSDIFVLFLLGVANLGLGMALFVTGARLVPSALAALLGTAETILSPVWVAVLHGEIPSRNTIIGGLMVLAALIAYLTVQFRNSRGSA